MSVQAQGHAACGAFWLGFSVPAQCSDAAPGGLIVPDGRWIAGRRPCVARWSSRGYGGRGREPAICTTRPGSSIRAAQTLAASEALSPELGWADVRSRA